MDVSAFNLDPGAGDCTTTVRITTRFRIILECKGDFRRLSTYRLGSGNRYQRTLATSRTLDRQDAFRVLTVELTEALREVSELKATMMPGIWSAPILLDREPVEQVAQDIISRLPVEQWLRQAKPDGVEEDLRTFQTQSELAQAQKAALEACRDARDAEMETYESGVDDGRTCRLSPLGEGRFSRVDIWRNLRVILEQKAGFRRLSVYRYRAKGSAVQLALATTLAPDLGKARKVIAAQIAAYRAEGNHIPESLAKRLPVAQWIDAMLDGIPAAESVRREDRGGPDALLVTPSVAGKAKVNTMARWLIAPGVTLCFGHRIDRPRLMIYYRDTSPRGRMACDEIRSIPIGDAAMVRQRLLAAILATSRNRPYRNHHGADHPLIALPDGPPHSGQFVQAIEDRLACLPIEMMIEFYDQSVLCIRRDGWKRLVYPELDWSMRWISQAGPDSLTASSDCWWVLVGTGAASARGRVFPWDGSPGSALEAAKRWRDKQEAEMGISFD